MTPVEVIADAIRGEQHLASPETLAQFAVDALRDAGLAVVVAADAEWLALLDDLFNEDPRDPR